MSAHLKPVPSSYSDDSSTREDVPPVARAAQRRAHLRGVRLWRGLAALAVVALALAGWGASELLSRKAAPAPSTPAQTITAGPVVKAMMTRTLVVNGSLAAWDELPIGSEAGGLAIVAVEVEEGDRVTRGQLMARLDDSVLKAELAQADAAIAQADAGLLKAEAMAATAGSDVNRAKALIKNGFISGQAAEQRQTTLTAAAADVNVARQNLEAAKAIRVERAAQLAQTEIRAPTDGIVSKRTATLGNVVAVGQQLFRIIRDGRVELRAEIPELDLLRLSAGQPVSITVGDADQRRFTGKIRLVGATVDPQTRIGIVYVALPDDPALKPGMFVHGLVETGSGETLQAPEEALVYKDAKPAVFVVDAGNRTHLRMVETGQRLDGVVEILSGVSAGERVALAGAGYLKDNDLVRVEQALTVSEPPVSEPPVSAAGRPAAGGVR
jgi:HlyD family secretion protein